MSNTGPLIFCQHTCIRTGAAIVEDDDIPHPWEPPLERGKVETRYFATCMHCKTEGVFFLELIQKDYKSKDWNGCISGHTRTHQVHRFIPKAGMRGVHKWVDTLDDEEKAKNQTVYSS